MRDYIPLRGPKAKQLESPVTRLMFSLQKHNMKHKQSSICCSISAFQIAQKKNIHSVLIILKALASDIRWVDSGKPLFRFSLRLNSTIYTEDQHLHRFFSHCSLSGDVTNSTSHDSETVNKLKVKNKDGIPPHSLFTPNPVICVIYQSLCFIIYSLS